MYYIILIVLFVAKANGIIIPTIAWILTGSGIAIMFTTGVMKKYTEIKKEEDRKTEEFLKRYLTQ